MQNQFTKKLVFRGLLPRTRWQSKEDGTLYRQSNIYFAKDNLAIINKAMRENPAALAEVERYDAGALRLDVFYGEQSGKAYGQLNEYVPYEYRPCSEVFVWEAKDVEKFIR